MTLHCLEILWRLVLLEAPAFESRIKRVIALSVAYDYIKTINIIFRKLHILFARYFKNMSNKKGSGMQVSALIKAKSVTAKVFTKETHANNHCQIGNAGLIIDSVSTWIEEISYF